jgi:uncharacterized SAM-binding protein YcdF (DUF218 family)
MVEEPPNERPSRRRLLAGFLAASGSALLFIAWVCFWPWPAPRLQEIPWEPDAIVVLGSGDVVRVREAARMAERFPEAPVIITGDSGFLERELLGLGVPPERLVIEPDAESTYENAALLAPILEEMEVKRAVIVTNWFHVPRAGAVFRSRFPEIQFESTWEAAEEPLLPWELQSQRREKLASIWYLVRYGVNAFRS